MGGVGSKQWRWEAHWFEAAVTGGVDRQVGVG
jgi:hypothetical protein